MVELLQPRVFICLIKKQMNFFFFNLTVLFDFILLPGSLDMIGLDALEPRDMLSSLSVNLVDDGEIKMQVKCAFWCHRVEFPSFPFSPTLDPTVGNNARPKSGSSIIV